MSKQEDDAFFKKAIERRLTRSRVLGLVFFVCSLLALTLLAAIFIFLIWGSRDVFLSPRVIFDLLTGTKWEPGGNNEVFGSLPLLYGSFLILLGGIFGIPVGIGMGIYISYFAPARVRNYLKPAIETIAIFPSVIIALFAIQILVPIIPNITPAESGFVAFTASICLGWYITPLMTSLTDDAIRAVPQQITSASISLGASKWETLRSHVLPQASPGIFAASLLAVGRLLGETIVVLLITGNTPQITNPVAGIFSQLYTIPAAILIGQADEPRGSFEFQVLHFLALELLALSFVLTIVAKEAVKNPDRIKRIFRPFLLLKTKITEGIRSVVSRKMSGVDEIVDIDAYPEGLSAGQIRWKIIREKIVEYSSLGMIIFTLLVLAFIPLTLVWIGFPSLINPRTYIAVPIKSNEDQGIAGLYPYILGTILAIVFASLISLPISTAMAVYLRYYSSEGRLTGMIRDSIISLSSVPSVVMGMFGLTLFVFILGFGKSLLSISLTLGIMMIPIAVTTTIEAMDQVPKYLEESALALGSTKWEAIKSHNLRYASGSIITGYIFSIARVIGETAPIVLTGAVLVSSRRRIPQVFEANGVPMLPFFIYSQIRDSLSPFRLEWAAAASIVLLGIAISLSLLGHLVRTKLRIEYA